MYQTLSLDTDLSKSYKAEVELSCPLAQSILAQLLLRFRAHLNALRLAHCNWT